MDKPQIMRVKFAVEPVKPSLPVRVVVTEPEPQRMASVAKMASKPGPTFSQCAAALEAEPGPDRYDIRTKWLWLHEAVVHQRERVERKGTASARRDLDMLEDLKEDYRRLVELVTGKPA